MERDVYIVVMVLTLSGRADFQIIYWMTMLGLVGLGINFYTHFHGFAQLILV